MSRHMSYFVTFSAILCQNIAKNLSQLLSLQRLVGKRGRCHSMAFAINI